MNLESIKSKLDELGDFDNYNHILGDPVLNSSATDFFGGKSLEEKLLEREKIHKRVNSSHLGGVYPVDRKEKITSFLNNIFTGLVIVPIRSKYSSSGYITPKIFQDLNREHKKITMKSLDEYKLVMEEEFLPKLYDRLKHYEELVLDGVKSNVYNAAKILDYVDFPDKEFKIFHDIVNLTQSNKSQKMFIADLLDAFKFGMDKQTDTMRYDSGEESKIDVYKTKIGNKNFTIEAAQESSEQPFYIITVEDPKNDFYQISSINMISRTINSEIVENKNSLLDKYKTQRNNAFQPINISSYNPKI